MKAVSTTDQMRGLGNKIKGTPIRTTYWNSFMNLLVTQGIENMLFPPIINPLSAEHFRANWLYYHTVYAVVN